RSAGDRRRPAGWQAGPRWWRQAGCWRTPRHSVAARPGGTRAGPVPAGAGPVRALPHPPDPGHGSTVDRYDATGSWWGLFVVQQAGERLTAVVQVGRVGHVLAEKLDDLRPARERFVHHRVAAALV